MINTETRPADHGGDGFAAEVLSLDAPARIAWAIERYGARAALTSSFGAQSAVLLHMATRVAPRIPVYFINTGFLFTETLAFKKEMEAALGLELRELHPRISREALLRKHGALYESNPDACCQINKVDVLQAVMGDMDCWISGLRQAQSASRAGKQVVEARDGGSVKLYPLIDWEDGKVEEYLHNHGLPLHPLAEEGYTSIGCAPCTAKPSEGGDARSGRWVGTSKTECGIHNLL